MEAPLRVVVMMPPEAVRIPPNDPVPLTDRLVAEQAASVVAPATLSVPDSASDVVLTVPMLAVPVTVRDPTVADAAATPPTTTSDGKVVLRSVVGT